MTYDQLERLTYAVDNLQDIWRQLGFCEERDTDIIEAMIRLLNGQIARAHIRLKEESDMPRGRKKKVDAVSAEVKSPAAHVTVPQDRTQLITEWKQASDQLTELKAKEHALRQALVASCFDGNKLEGTESIDIGWGYSLKVSKELNYSAMNENMETETLIAELEKRGASELAEKIIKWKPEVSKPAYRRTFETATQIGDTVLLELLHKTITVKPGMPQLEMIATGEVITDGSNVKW